MMTIYRDISVIWTMFNIQVFFVIMMEFRFAMKRTCLYCTCFFIPLAAFDLWYLLQYGPARMAQSIFLIMMLPSVCFYFFLSKYRDGRFLYTFFLICDLNADLTIITYLIDRLLPGQPYIWMLATRLVLFPLLNFAAYKWLRTPYLSVQHDVKRGWFGLALTAALFYVLVIMLFSYPSMIENRPEGLIPLILTVALTPLINWYIFVSLRSQQALHEAREREQLLSLQTASLEKQTEQTAKAEQRLSIWQHDLRHHFRTLAVMLDEGNINAAREYIASSDASILAAKDRKLCANPVLNAVFSYYFHLAEESGIRVESELDAPYDIGTDARELSVVFANALENAITAVKNLPESKRIIQCRLISYPQLMFRISNPFDGDISFDDEGLPLSSDGKRKTGTLSVDAYCKKHGAWCDYFIKDGLFTMQLTKQ